MSVLREIIEREDGAISMLRVFALCSFATVLVLIYLELFTNKSIAHFGEFATFTITLIALAAGKSVAEVKAGMGAAAKNKGASL